MTTPSSPTVRPTQLRLVVTGQHTTDLANDLECVSVLRLKGLRAGQREDPVPSAWRDFLALLWAGTAKATEMVEIVHEFKRRDDGRPESYGQWVRLWQAPSARPSSSRAALTVAVRSAMPRLVFEECPPAQIDDASWVTLAHLAPESVRIATPALHGLSLQGTWPHPGQLPNWKLSVPVDEPLCECLRVHCRFSTAELSSTERESARRLLKLISSGHGRAVHPDAAVEGENHHPELAAQLVERLQLWVHENRRGFRFDAVIATPSGQALSAYALRRIASDLFGSMPCRTTILDDCTASPGVAGLPILHEQGLPGCFIAANRLTAAFGVAELSDAPTKLPVGPGAVIGEVGGQDVTLPHSHAASHCMLIGGSGAGKSSAVLRLLQQDIQHGLGVGLIDPHGETADRLRELVPPSRQGDVIWVDVDDPGCNAAINPMEGTKEDIATRTFVAGQLVHVIKNNGETMHSWGPAAQNHLLQCFLLAMCHPLGGTIFDAARLLENDDHCSYLLSKNQDESLASHFRHWRQTGGDHGYDSWRPWLLARLHPFTKSRAMMRLLHRPSTIDVGRAMNESKIMIFRLGKATLSELECQLLGTTLLMEFHRAAMARACQPADKRPLFRLAVDEFQNFASDATAPGILREARKYNLGLVAATQSLGSLTNLSSRQLKDALLVNTATKVILRVSPSDAAVLDDYVLPEFSRADLMRTPNFEAVVCMSAGGVPPMRVRLHRPDEVSPAPNSPSDLNECGALKRDLVIRIDQYLATRHGIRC